MVIRCRKFFYVVVILGLHANHILRCCELVQGFHPQQQQPRRQLKRTQHPLPQPSRWSSVRQDVPTISSSTAGRNFWLVSSRSLLSSSSCALLDDLLTSRGMKYFKASEVASTSRALKYFKASTSRALKYF